MDKFTVYAPDLDEWMIDYVEKTCTMHMRRGSQAADVIQRAHNQDMISPGGILLDLEIEEEDGSIHRVGRGRFNQLDQTPDELTSTFVYLDAPKLRGKAGLPVIDDAGFVPLKLPENDTSERWTLTDASKGEFRYEGERAFSGRAVVQIRNDTGKTIQKGDLVFFGKPGEWSTEVVDTEEPGPIERRLLERARLERECPDCKADPGWYNGLDSRKPCPTCKGGE